MTEIQTNYLKKTLFFWCLLIFSISKGQKTFADLPGKDIAKSLLFERLYTTNGLPDDRVRSLYQDSKGFLWIATMNGICKYDGYSFKSFLKANKPNTISANWASTICEDQTNNIWIGTRLGLNRLDQNTEKFVTYKANPRQLNSLPNNKVNTLQFDNSGKLWIGTPGGLTKFDPRTEAFQTFTTYPLNLSVSKIIKSTSGKLWIANAEGVIEYNTQNNQFHFYPVQLIANSYGDKVWAMVESNKNLYLATARNGLLKLAYNSISDSYKAIESCNQFAGSNINLKTVELFDITQSKTGDFWIATASGLVRIEKIDSALPTINIYHNNPLNSKSISNDGVYSLLIDKTDILWSGTELGLNKLDINLLPFQYFTFTQPSSKDQVRSIFTNDGKVIWLGTFKSGLYRFNLADNLTNSYKFTQEKMAYNSHRSILIDQSENVFIGTLGGTLELKKDQYKTYGQEIEGLTTFAILQDSRKNVWLGTTRGLFRISETGEKTSYLPNAKYPNSIAEEYIRAIYEDHNGFIWIGFESAGISYLNPNTGKFYKLTDEAQQNMAGSNVYTLLEYPSNTIWAGTESGLNRIDIMLKNNGQYNCRIKPYVEKKGMGDKAVNGLLSDDQGNLWLATVKGLGRFNIKNETYQSFINSLSFNYNSFFNFQNQQLFFGTTDGFVMFDPNSIMENSIKPDLVISEFKLFNQNVGINESINGQTILNKGINNVDEITLNYKNNVFTIGFTALHFINPDNNQYAYQLEGFDKEWVTASANKRNATYTNLDAGTYYFKVKAANSLGQWNTNTKSLKITILPPPWKTWWAYTLYFLVLAGLVYIFFRYMLIQARHKQQLRYEQLQKEQMQHLDQMKMKFFTNVSHEFRTPLSLIIGPAEELLSSVNLNTHSKSQVQLIQRNSKKLLYLMDELMTFQTVDQGKLELKLKSIELVSFIKDIHASFAFIAQKKSINYSFSHEIAELRMAVDPDKLEMIVNNLIYNAFKFTPEGGEIIIRIERKDSTSDEKAPAAVSNVCISVEDNGKGILPEELTHLFERFFQSKSSRVGTGIGLSLTKSLVELHKGSITAKSNPRIKTVFQVCLPVPDLATKVSDETPLLHQEGIYIDHHNAAVLLEDFSTTDTKKVNRKSLHQVLIVEDNLEILNYLCSILNGKYQVHKAMNGKEGLARIKEVPPDLIISDVMMPEMEGTELCKLIKNDINYSHIPFILLTAKSGVEHKIDGFELGADEYISKPFHPELLRVRVKKLIEANKRLIEKFKSNEIVIPKDIITNPLDQAFIENVLKYIEEHLSDEELSVEELGSAVAMSRSNLFRKIKAITGETPIELIYNTRLKWAMKFLLERKLNVSEISYHVGFKSSSAFIKSFKKKYGKAPMEYLNQVIAEHTTI